MKLKITLEYSDKTSYFELKLFFKGDSIKIHDPLKKTLMEMFWLTFNIDPEDAFIPDPLELSRSLRNFEEKFLFLKKKSVFYFQTLLCYISTIEWDKKLLRS